MFWLSYVVFAIIIAGLLYAKSREMYLVQVLLIQNLLIFMVVNIPYYPYIPSPILKDLAGAAIYISEPTLLLLKAHTFLTMMFLHGGIMHIFGNIIILFFIGMALEERVGKRWTAIFYFAAGLIATLGQYFFNYLQYFAGASSSTVLLIPNIGASGAIFGIMGALVFLYPRDKITMLLGPILVPEVRVDLAVGVFIVMQTGIAFLSPGVTNIAHAAHFTGFAGGIILAAYAKRSNVLEEKEGPTRDYTKLKKLIQTEEEKETYKKIIDADERDVKEAWAEHLIEGSACPECGRPLEDEECECGFKVWED